MQTRARKSKTPPVGNGGSPAKTREISSAQELFNFIFAGCNILRGPVGQDSFKDYITPLIYLKRLSDVYDEELERALRESHGDEAFAQLPEQHSFIIPEGCHWQDLRERTENIGSAIIETMRAIERHNPDTLYGVLSTFSRAQWSNKNVLSDARLKDLVEHFSKVKLTVGAYSTDMMGDAYEYLLKKFADLSKAKAGEFYTPRPVVRLLVKILDPRPGEKVYDPACGSGGMLIEALRHMNHSTLACGRIFGQEKNVTNAAVARMNLFLHGTADIRILQGDTLRNPKILENGRLAQFDCVIANPPFSLKNWGAREWASDPYYRNLWGVPPDSCGDFAWVEHMVASMKPATGRVAVVLPLGVLFRGNQEEKIRREMLQGDKLECVITLADRLFYGAGIPACILVFRDRKPKARVGRVLMIDASAIFTARRAQNELSPENVETIYRLYVEGRDAPGVARVVPLRKIEEKGWPLSVNRYIEREAPPEPPYDEVRNAFLAACEALRQAEDNFAAKLRRKGGAR